MKKCTLLALTVLLAVSTNAWAGFLSFNLSVSTTQDSASGTFRFTGPKDARICVDPIQAPRDKCFTVKIFADCKDCGCPGTKSFSMPICFGRKLCPGTYKVNIEVYCRCSKCCHNGCPKLVTKLTSSFTISGKH
jgi:hypothetical protein